MLNTMVSFVILLIARTARIACADRQTYRQTDRQTDTHTHTHKTTTVTLAAHARRRLINMKLHNHSTVYTSQEQLGNESRFPKVITIVLCSLCRQLNNKPRIVVSDICGFTNCLLYHKTL